MPGNIKISHLPEVTTLLDSDVIPIVTIEEDIPTTKIITAENLRSELGGGSSAAEILPLVYPVGSIFMNTIATNPATIFGFGTWVAWGTGRVPVGVDTGQSEFNTVEEIGGSKQHTLSTNEMPVHTHTQDAHTHTQASHTHTQNSHNHTQDAHTHSQNSHNHTQNQHEHDVVYSGNGKLLNMNTGSDTYKLEWQATGSAYANVKAKFTTPTNNAATASNQNTTATNNATTAVNQSATAFNNSTEAANQNSGGGSAHNNLQPYITCYMWKRTA